MTNQLFLSWWAHEIIKDKESDRIGVHAGYGSGKTFNAIQVMMQRIQTSPNVKFFVFTEPTYRLIKSIAIPKFEMVLNNFRLKEKVDYRIYKGDTIYIDFIKRKQTILLFSCERPDNLVGFDAMLGMRDEAGLCKKESRERLSSRLRDNNGAYKPQLVDIGTTEGINDFADQYDNERGEGWVQYAERDFKKEIYNHITKLYSRYRSFRVTTYDNPYMDKQYITQLYADYGYNENYIKAYIYGYFVPFVEGLACTSYKSTLHKRQLHEDKAPDPFKDLIMSFDFNANPVSWVVAQEGLEEVELRVFEKVINILDESQLGYGLLADSLEEFEVKFPPYVYKNTRILIYGDRSGYSSHFQSKIDAYQEIKKELTSRGYQHVEIRAPKDVTSEAVSIEAVNKIFYDNKCFLNSKVKGLEESLLNMVLVKNERKLKKDGKDLFSHKYDAFKYLVCHHIFNTTRNKVYNYNI